MELQLTVEEQEFLRDVLEHYQRELLLEISHAAHHDFKTALREREGLLEALLDKVRFFQVSVK
jgi:hypothetical protein